MRHLVAPRGQLLSPERGTSCGQRPGQALVVKVILHARARGTGDPRRGIHVGHVENEPKTRIKRRARVYNTVLGTHMRCRRGERTASTSPRQQALSLSFLQTADSSKYSRRINMRQYQNALAGLDPGRHDGLKDAKASLA